MARNRHEHNYKNSSDTLTCVICHGLRLDGERPAGISGSKSDGTVKIAATYSVNGKASYPGWLTEDNRRTAVQRCGARSYTDAEAFGGFDSRCTRSVYDLLVGRVSVQTPVTITYQCTGGGS